MTLLRLGRTALGLAPLAVIALVAGFAGGCTKGEPAKAPDQELTEGDRPEAMASLPAAFAKRGQRHAELGARTLTNAQRLLPGARTAGTTPLDQLLAEGDRPLASNGLCPPDMASIDDLYCVDRYEGSLLELFPGGEERPFSPYASAAGHLVRAVSERNIYPQGYINANEAQEACARSGKRLCKPREWTKACMGPQRATYGYGNENQPRRCNDHGKSPLHAVYAANNLNEHSAWSHDRMNDPALNQVEGTLARAGQHEGCTNDYGVYDMVGNLHEWVADPAGTFQGGYYQDTHQNGDGCTYKTTAHASWYHDYSTGFRCCADVAQ